MIYGQINKFKGEDIIIKLINSSYKLNFVVHGIHDLEKHFHNNNNVILNGKYENKDMLEIIKKEDPSVILFTSVFAETFCYALNHAIKSGYPVICPNFGSFVELSNFIHHKLLIDPYELTETMILNFINELPTKR